MSPPVTYTEGIPDRKTLRIHSVYVQGVAFDHRGWIPWFRHLTPAQLKEKKNTQFIVPHCIKKDTKGVPNNPLETQTTLNNVPPVCPGGAILAATLFKGN